MTALSTTALSAIALPPAPEMARALRAQLMVEASDFDAVDWLTETGSTNTDLMAWLRERYRNSDTTNNAAPNNATAHGARLLGAHWQHSGRGRVGRKLLNQPGDMLMFSCAFATRIAPAQLPCLSLAAGLAACEVLRRHAHPGQAARLAIKWPNDFQLGEAKLAGLLVESLRHRAAGVNAYGVVMGMGMNLRAAQRLTETLQRPVADWSQAAGQTPLPVITAAIALAWQEALQLCAHEGFAAFQARFRAVDALHGRTVNVIDAGLVLHSGVARGVDDHGRLLVEDGARTHAVAVGEVSVRAQPNPYGSAHENPHASPHKSPHKQADLAQS